MKNPSFSLFEAVNMEYEPTYDTFKIKMDNPSGEYGGLDIQPVVQRHQFGMDQTRWQNDFMPISQQTGPNDFIHRVIHTFCVKDCTEDLKKALIEKGAKPTETFMGATIPAGHPAEGQPTLYKRLNDAYDKLGKRAKLKQWYGRRKPTRKYWWHPNGD